MYQYTESQIKERFDKGVEEDKDFVTRMAAGEFEEEKSRDRTSEELESLEASVKRSKRQQETIEYLGRGVIEGRITMDFNGHELHLDNALLLHDMTSSIIWKMFNMDEFEVAFEKAKSGEAAMDLGYTQRSCRNCPKSIMHIHWEGDKIIIDDVPCAYAEGFKPYDVEIDIPSGKMVLANSLNYWYDYYKEFPEDDKLQYGDHCINTNHGQKMISQLYPKCGAARMHVSNGACNMFQTDDTKANFIMGTFEDGEWILEEGEEEKKWPKGHVQVGDVCTDFWGYFICDYEDFKTRLDKDDTIELGYKSKYSGVQEHKLKYKYTKVREDFDRDMSLNIIECKPGRYRLTHYFHDHDSAGESCYVFTDIKHIGE